MSPFNCLLRYPLFALLDRKDLARWLTQGQTVSVPTGRTLLEAGTPGRDVWLVLEGSVRVLSHGKDEREVVLGSFGPGEIFGEYALLPPHQNTATCRARETSRVVRLPLAPLRHLLETTPGVMEHLKNWLRLHALVSHLRSQTFLGFLSAPSVLPLLDRCDSLELPAGCTVQTEGLSDDCWFFIRSGQLAQRPPGDGEAPPRMLGPGECLGEPALCERKGPLPRTEVAQEASLLRLSREEFRRPLTGEAPSLLQTINPARGVARRLLEWVPQTGAVDCGVAALTMAALQLGCRVTLEQVAARMRLGDRGASLDVLANAAGGLGLRPTVVRIAPTLLSQVHGVAVAHLRDEHYVALFHVGLQSVTVGDPAQGVVDWPLARFVAAWSGVLLLLAPAPPSSDSVIRNREA